MGNDRFGMSGVIQDNAFRNLESCDPVLHRHGQWFAAMGRDDILLTRPYNRPHRDHGKAQPRSPIRLVP